MEAPRTEGCNVMAPCICLILASVSIGAVQPVAVREVPGAVDDDADVDWIDHRLLVDCLTGPRVEPSAACASADLDVDRAVTLRDYADLQVWFSGDLPHTSAEIGAAGGSIEFNRCRVTVPQGLLAAPVGVTVTQLPSQQAEVATDLGPDRCQAIGAAYVFRAPVFSTEPFDLTFSYEASDVPPGFDPANLAILFRADNRSFEGPGAAGDSDPPPQGASYAVLPATVDTSAQTVSLAIHGSGTYQLAALSAPLRIWESPGGTTATPTSTSVPKLRVIFWDDPPGDERLFREEIERGVIDAHTTLVGSLGFPDPSGEITVEVRSLAGRGLCAGVPRSNPFLIYVHPAEHCGKRKVVAHEYFHVIQGSHTNAASVVEIARQSNKWFIEGTAAWASDVVFDSIPDRYNAPAGNRFTIPLNQPGESDDFVYETVGFWKWFAERNPGGIQAILARHYVTTVADGMLLDLVPAYFLEHLAELFPSLEFPEFAVDALYYKNFDTDETGAGDLFAEDRLGPTNTLPLYFDADAFRTTFGSGRPGDSGSNVARLDYTLSKYLTATVAVIENATGAEALEGTLHLKFGTDFDEPLAVRIISTESGRERKYSDVGAAGEILVPFRKDSKIVVIPAYGQWKDPDPFSVATTRQLEAWVERCGGDARGRTFDAANEVEMYAALEQAANGDTVRLGPGTYHPTFRDYALPNNAGTIQARLLIPRGVTLAGSGQDETRIEMPWQGIGGNRWAAYLLEDATIRNLTISANNNSLIHIGFGPVETGIDRVSLCNVNLLSAAAQNSYAFYHEPYYAGGRYLVEIINTTVNCASCAGANMTGIGLVGYDSSQRVDAHVFGSTVSGWTEGVYYGSYSTTNVDAECSDFFGNTYNVHFCLPAGCVDECAPGGP